MVQPDLLFVSENRRQIIRPDGIHGAPDLAVEILSPSTRRWGRSEKRRRYFHRGVAELWIVDPPTRTVEIHRFTECRSGPLLTLSSFQSLTTPLLPGFKLPVWKLFEP